MSKTKKVLSGCEVGCDCRVTLAQRKNNIFKLLSLQRTRRYALDFGGLERET